MTKLRVLPTDHPVPVLDLSTGSPVMGRYVGMRADGTVGKEVVEVPDLPIYRNALAEGHLVMAPDVEAIPAPTSKKPDKEPKL